MASKYKFHDKPSKPQRAELALYASNRPQTLSARVYWSYLMKQKKVISQSFFLSDFISMLYGGLKYDLTIKNTNLRRRTKSPSLLQKIFELT